MVLFLDSCSARAWEHSPTVRDNPLPEAVRWLSRRVQLHSISVELPFEVRLAGCLSSCWYQPPWSRNGGQGY